MSGMSLPPVRVSRLAPDGCTPIALNNPQDVQITSGQGMIVRTSGRALLLDAQLSEAPESFHLYKHGVIAAGDVLGTWRNTSRARTILLRKLLANFRVAPTAGDGTNFLRLKVTDAASAVAVLPVSTAAQRSYLLDQGLGQILEQGAGYQPGGLTTFSMAHQGYGIAHAFTVAQKMSVLSLQINRGLTTIRNSAAAGTAGTMRGAILDSLGNVVASGYAPVSSTTAGAAARFPFQVAAVLNPGQTYWLAFDCFEAGPAFDGTSATDPVRVAIYLPTGGTGTGAPSGVLNFTGAVATLGFTTGQPTPAQLATVTWRKIIDGTMVAPPGTTVGGGGQGRAFDWTAHGSPSSLAVMAGDLTFSVEGVGTVDPVTMAGTDLNLHAVLSAS